MIEVGPLDENLDELNIVKLQEAKLRDEILNKGVILILDKLQGVELRDGSLMLKVRTETRGLDINDNNRDKRGLNNNDNIKDERSPFRLNNNDRKRESQVEQINAFL